MKDAVRACPHCGSTDIGHNSLDVVSRLSLSGARECRECGYAGIFPEIDADRVDEFDGADGSVAVEQGQQGNREKGGRGRLLIGTVMLLLGIGASSHATWGNGLLAGLLALVVGAAVVVDEIGRR
ncbi:MAG: hypothetical protein SVW02_03110 [Candidatus Nanohaloarchaea archaeon]|nr:hypothetical protein [Candidatus Nanohaloarchaea archaeon]